MRPQESAGVTHLTRGVLPVLQVPFDDTGTIDQVGLSRTVDFAIEHGSIGLAFGFVSEYFRLTEQERESVVAIAVEAAEGRVPIVAPCSGESVSAVRHMLRRAQSSGACLAIVNPPSIVRPDSDQLRHFFSHIAEEGMPLMIQDAPHMTGVEMPVPLLVELAEIEGVAHFKIEAAASWVKMYELRNTLGDKYGIYGGHGGFYLLPELRAGADGVMPSAAHPHIYTRLLHAFWSGSADDAEQQYQRLLPYLIASSASLDEHIWIQKEILRQLGIIDHNHLRMPAGRPAPLSAQLALVLASKLGVLNTGSTPQTDLSPAKNRSSERAMTPTNVAE